MVSHLQHLVTPLHELRADIPHWMADWVMWLISREMDDRPANAREALEYFNAKKSGLPTTGVLPPTPPTPVVKVVGRGAAPRPTQPIAAGTQAKQAKGQPDAAGADWRSRHSADARSHALQCRQQPPRPRSG